MRAVALIEGEPAISELLDEEIAEEIKSFIHEEFPDSEGEIPALCTYCGSMTTIPKKYGHIIRDLVHEASQEDEDPRELVFITLCPKCELILRISQN